MSFQITAKNYEEDVVKALMPVQGSAFQMEDSTALIEHREVTPRLLTALLTGAVQEDTFTTNTFVYDEIKYGNALPTGKSFTENGGRVGKDKPVKRRWEIGSFGITGDVAPADYIKRIKAGTNQYLTEADVLATQLNPKMASAWDLFMEQQLITLITTDTNSAAGGPAEEYNFYTDIVGGSRSVANIAFSDANAKPMEQIRAQKKILKEQMIKSGEPLANVVVICGSNFFANALEEEANSDLARPLKSVYDFASRQVTSSNVDGSGFDVDNFESSLAGVTFIQYEANIGGVSIGDDDAYMIPVQANNFIRVGYAPAQTREYANTVALKKYSWSGVHDRQGVVVAEESNFLTAMTNPLMMRAMVAA